MNSVPAGAVPRIGASRNRKSRALTAGPVPGKDRQTIGNATSGLRASFLHPITDGTIHAEAIRRHRSRTTRIRGASGYDWTTRMASLL